MLLPQGRDIFREGMRILAERATLLQTEEVTYHDTVEQAVIDVQRALETAGSVTSQDKHNVEGEVRLLWLRLPVRIQIRRKDDDSKIIIGGYTIVRRKFIKALENLD